MTAHHLMNNLQFDVRKEKGKECINGRHSLLDSFCLVLRHVGVNLDSRLNIKCTLLFTVKVAVLKCIEMCEVLLTEEDSFTVSWQRAGTVFHKAAGSLLF